MSNMDKLQEIMKKAEAEVSQILGYPAKVSIITKSNETLETYAKIWDFIFAIARKEISSNKKLNTTSTLADYTKIYVWVCSKHVINIDIRTCMQVIGKDRTTYYHSLETAYSFIKNQDKRFVQRLSLTIEQLKQNGYTRLEI